MKMWARIRAVATGFIMIASATVMAQHAPRVYTIQELFTRNVGSSEQQNKQFPPHKIVGNVYYVGTESLSSFLVTTPNGHILIDSVFERTVPTIQDSVQKLGFKFEDIEDCARQPCTWRSSRGRRPGGETHRRSRDGDGRGHPAPAADAISG